MSAIIKPEPGRHVHFYSANRQPDDQPQAAIVCHVHNDWLVNLSVFDIYGVNCGYTSVPLVQPGESHPAGCDFATWMPYQAGKAQEALERAEKACA